MISRKIYECNISNCQFGDLDMLILELAREIRECCYTIKSVEMKPIRFETGTILKEPNLIITLEGKQI